MQEGRWAEALAPLPLATCGPDTSLAEAVCLLVEQRKHRVYVSDVEGSAVGVITPTDVLRTVACT